MTRATKGIVRVAALAAWSGLTAACGGGGSSSSSPPPDPTAGCTNGTYVLDGDFRADACKSFILAASKTTTDNAHAPAWVKPVAGAILPGGGPPPAFTWTAGTLGGGDPAYMIVFRDVGQHELLRVLTTQTTYTPDDAAWSKLAAAPLEPADGGTLAVDAGLPQTEATIAAVGITGSQLQGDPITGQPRTFYIGP